MPWENDSRGLEDLKIKAFRRSPAPVWLFVKNYKFFGVWDVSLIFRRRQDVTGGDFGAIEFWMEPSTQSDRLPEDEDVPTVSPLFKILENQFPEVGNFPERL